MSKTKELNKEKRTRGFKKGSHAEFVASILMHKIEHFKKLEDEEFMTIVSWADRCDLPPTSREYSALKSAIGTMEKLNLIEVEEKYVAHSDEGHYPISKQEYDDFMEKSNKCLKEVLGEELFKTYNNYYVFHKRYSRSNRRELENKYRELMNSSIGFVYRTYRFVDVSDKTENNAYIRLLEVFNEDEIISNTIRLIESLEMELEV